MQSGGRRRSRRPVWTAGLRVGDVSDRVWFMGPSRDGLPEEHSRHARTVSREVGTGSKREARYGAARLECRGQERDRAGPSQGSVTGHQLSNGMGTCGSGGRGWRILVV
jgi:hypothetical protein